jgi:hypothetical protein
MFSVVQRLVAPLVFLATSALAPTAQAATQLCGVGFDSENFNLTVKPVQPDEEAGCGRFLVGKSTITDEPVHISVAVAPGALPRILKETPSNFFLTKNGRVAFKLPDRVKDGRHYYFVRPLRIMAEQTINLPNGQIHLAEYKRQVDRIKKLSEQQEIEVSETQLCVSGLRFTNEIAVFVGGCTLVQDGSRLSKQVRDLIRSLQMPIVR